MVPAAHTPLAPADQANNVIGYIRGFDVVTGKLLWTFHTVPQPGERGYETWLNDSARTGGGNAGVWATISADEQLGLAYLPVESPYGDMYGGLRPGANLYGESIVAVDIRSRRTALALPDVASSAVGLRHSDGADPRRRRQGWSNDQSAGAGHQAGPVVRAES